MLHPVQSQAAFAPSFFGSPFGPRLLKPPRRAGGACGHRASGKRGSVAKQRDWTVLEHCLVWSGDLGLNLILSLSLSLFLRLSFLAFVACFIVVSSHPRLGLGRRDDLGTVLAQFPKDSQALHRRVPSWNELQLNC